MARWCWVEKGGCGRHRVIFSSYNHYKVIDKPFKCKNCGKLWSYEELGVKRLKNSSNYVPKNPRKVNALKRILYENNSWCDKSWRMET